MWVQTSLMFDTVGIVQPNTNRDSNQSKQLMTSVKKTNTDPTHSNHNKSCYYKTQNISR